MRTSFNNWHFSEHPTFDVIPTGGGVQIEAIILKDTLSSDMHMLAISAMVDRITNNTLPSCFSVQEVRLLSLPPLPRHGLSHMVDQEGRRCLRVRRQNWSRPGSGHSREGLEL